MTTTQRRLSTYVKLLAQPAAARGTTTKYGCDVLDILSQSLQAHLAVSNLSFWQQPSLSCYTPSPEFHAAHSLLAETSAGNYYVPDTSASPYPTVLWSRVSGTVNAMAVLPDGFPPVHEIKILDSDPNGAVLGSPWAFQTVDLGAWAGGLGTTSPGQFDESRGIAVTLRLGSSDAPPPTVIELLTDVALVALGQSVSDGSSPGDVRVSVGNIWSVLFPVNGDPCFEKRFPYRDKDGTAHEWSRLHTFAGAVPDRSLDSVPQFLVTFLNIAGRLQISVGGHSVVTDAFCYSEPDPKNPQSPSAVKTLRIAPASVQVTGRAGGGPRWIGIRRIQFQIGQFSRVLSLGSNNPADLSVDGIGWRNEVGDPGINITVVRPYPTQVYYTAQVRGTGDGGRTCAALKWVRAHADRASAGGSGEYVDYGGAVKLFDESMAEPDFFGGGGTRGSDGSVDLTLDLYELDQIALASGTSWRADLAPYAPVTFVLGQSLGNADGTGYTEVETTRLTGYLEESSDDLRGFNDGEVRRTLRDQWLRLKDPAAFIDTYYAPLSVCLTSPDSSGYIYGWQGIQLILNRAINADAGSSLKVFLPANWYGLAQAVGDPQVLGRLPANDLPLLASPYGKYAGEFIKQIAEMDFAALYPAGNVWIYGHFDLIVANTPVYDVYDGRGSDGNPPTAVLPDSQLAWVASGIKRVFNSSQDFNRFVVWGDVPGGAGSDAPKNLGAPLLAGEARDFSSIAASWERTKLFQGGQFYEQKQVDQFAQVVLSLTDSAKTAVHLEVEFSFALPEVFWGHKMTLHGFPDIQAADGTGVSGKTFRVYKLTHTGNLTTVKVTTRVTLIEMLAGES
ncbi:MAG: hypothetical protein ACRYFS_03590 [Janthinobacterium lividum]